MSSSAPAAPKQPAPSTLREGLAVVRRGIAGEPRWFALAVLGATVYGVMTGLMAWAIGWVVDKAVAPAIEAPSAVEALATSRRASCGSSVVS